MPRYYCDYCDTYLTHDSAPGRKQHNRGWKHRDNVRDHYQEYVADFYERREQRGGPGVQNYGFNLPPRGMGPGGPRGPLFPPMMGGPPPNFPPGPMGGPMGGPPPHMMGMPPHGMPPQGLGPPPSYPPQGQPPHEGPRP